MADIQLDDGRDRGDRFGRRIIEPMAGMDFEAKAVGEPRSVPDANPFCISVCQMPGGERFTPGAGVNLDRGSPDSRRRLDLAGVGGNEKRNPDAGRDQLRHDGSEQIVLCASIEPALGRQLLAPLGHQAGRVRLRPQRHGGHLVGCRHLEIERLGDFGLEADDVGVANMPAILAQMRGDPIGSGRDGDFGRLDRIGVRAAASISYGRDVIDIDPEPEMRNRRQFIDPFGIPACCVALQALTRSAFATTCLARNCAMIEVRCLRS